MSVTLSSTETSALVFLALFVFLVVRRTIRQLRGAPYSPGRLWVFAGLYVLLFSALAFTTLFAAVSTWGTDAYVLLAPYVATPCIAAFLAAPYVERVVRFERREDGQLYYRLSWHIPVLYLVLFTARFVAEIVVFGLAGVIVSFPPPLPPTVTDLGILIGVDLLFAVSLGLLVGRGVGVYEAHRALPPETVPPPSPPLPSG